MPILGLREIKKSFGATVALDGVNLALEKGKVHALIGENGAGKSTLMNILSGSLRADSGEMQIKEKSYSPTNPLDARLNRVALIHQELSLAPHLSVAENILMGMENSRFGWLNRQALHKRALEVLEYFQHPDIRPESDIAIFEAKTSRAPKFATLKQLTAGSPKCATFSLQISRANTRGYFVEYCLRRWCRLYRAKCALSAAQLSNHPPAKPGAFML